jgi:hypothetical protein
LTNLPEITVLQELAFPQSIASEEEAQRSLRDLHLLLRCLREVLVGDLSILLYPMAPPVQLSNPKKGAVARISLLTAHTSRLPLPAGVSTSHRRLLASRS